MAGMKEQLFTEEKPLLPEQRGVDSDVSARSPLACHRAALAPPDPLSDRRGQPGNYQTAVDTALEQMQRTHRGN
ncbi:unnamed protein product [Lota lota]